MKHLFVPYKIALALKEKGFDEKCLAFYKHEELKMVQVEDFSPFSNSDVFYNFYVTAPLYQQVVNWLRDNHGIFLSQSNEAHHLAVYIWNRNDNSTIGMGGKTPTEALDAAIIEALKLI